MNGFLVVGLLAVGLIAVGFYSLRGEAELAAERARQDRERRARDDVRRMSAWYESRRFTIEGESEAEIAERLIEAS